MNNFNYILQNKIITYALVQYYLLDHEITVESTITQ